MNNQVKIFISVIAILILGVAATIFLQATKAPAGPGEYDQFAQCLKDKGAVFYGAFWCPHCKAQKAMFGSSVKLLPYQECSLADGSGQNQMCNDKGIKSYPTWRFADGSELSGEIALSTLADKTGCVLPGGAAAAPVPAESGASSSAVTPVQE